MTAAPRKFTALVLALLALGACTYWTKDAERIVDQSNRDFSIDPDVKYKDVDLADIMAHPTGFKYMAVRFPAVINRLHEAIFSPLYTTFRPDDFVSFSAWPADAKLWEAQDRMRSLPTLFMRKANPHVQGLIDTNRFALVEVRGVVMGDFEQLPWINVFYVDEVTPVLYTEESLQDYKAGMDAYSKNIPAQAIAKLESAVNSPLSPKVRVQVRLILGKLYEGRGDFERAARHYDAILLDDENNNAAWDGWERCEKALEAKRAAEGAAQPRRKKQ